MIFWPKIFRRGCNLHANRNQQALFGKVIVTYQKSISYLLLLIFASTRVSFVSLSLAPLCSLLYGRPTQPDLLLAWIWSDVVVYM